MNSLSSLNLLTVANVLLADHRHLKRLSKTETFTLVVLGINFVSLNKMANANNEKRISRWYFGGLASSGAAVVTHPLDLIKVTIIFIKT